MKNQRKGIILPTVMITFVITMTLFVAGSGYISTNAKTINRVKQDFDYKSVLINFHQLSYAKMTDLASGTEAFDFYDDSEPVGGFENFVKEFKGQLSNSIFSDQWEVIEDDFSATSNHVMILSYSSSATNDDNLFIDAFSEYINSLDSRDKEEIMNCESMVVALSQTDRKALLINRLELKSGKKKFSAALFQKSYYNKYLYFTEDEPVLWFTDGDVINGPLATYGTIHIDGNPNFNGTVYCNPKAGDDGFIIKNNSEKLFHGEPATAVIGEVDFKQDSDNYKDKMKKNNLPFSTLLTSVETIYEATDVSDSRYNWTYINLSVPATCTKLVVKTWGGSGDADLYIRKDENPTTGNYLAKSSKSQNDEMISIDNPVQGSHIIGIYAYKAYSGLNITVEYTSKDKAIFGFTNFASYTATVPEENQIDFKAGQALILDVNPADYNIDIDDNEIIIDWAGEKERLRIIHKEKFGQENTYEATYTYYDGQATYTTSGVPFSGFISAEDKRIYLGGHDRSNESDLCYYDGKLSFYTTNKIYVENSFIPTELKEFADLKYKETWDNAKNEQIVDFYNTQGVDSSLNIVSDDFIYIGSYYDKAKENQKIFASLYSFGQEIEVYKYDSIPVKKQLTIFGSMMQKQRGAVGTYKTESVKNVVYTDKRRYDRYRINGGSFQGGKRVWFSTTWYDLYDCSDIHEQLYYETTYSNVNLYYYSYKTVSYSGFNKNYMFDPRFAKDYTPPNGTPVDPLELHQIISSIIEVY